jgi:hypothetical protein
MKEKGRMSIEVTEVTGDGTIRRAMVDTSGRGDARRWEQLAEDASLGYPPPYRAVPGESVYYIRAGKNAAQVGERDLAGPLLELVRAVLAEGTEVL